MNKNDKIILDILRQMYLEATPSLNLDEAMESGLTKQDDWYLNYFLDNSRQKEIIEEQLKGKRLTKLKKIAINFNVFMYAPKG
jgi:hypothetical protein